MVEAIVSFAIEKLNHFVTERVNIRTGVVDGVEWLKDELSYLLTSVRAAETQRESDLICLWIDNVKDVANEAVIILERFSAQQEEQAVPEQGVLNCMRSFICICKKEANLYDIGKDIESLKEKIIRLKNRRDEYHIDHIITATPNLQRRKRTVLRAASFDHEEDVIGFKDDIQTLLAQLGDEDPSLSLISIHGMGGLGKSTLASKLYHSSELSHFKRHAWVCVSEDYNIENVLRKVINSFTGQKLSSLNMMEEIELLRHLRKILLDGGHYLVVIDDIWDAEVWKQIRSAFPDKKDGSRVIITTRSKLVAEGVDDTCFVHELRFLGEEESWQLFCKRAKPSPNLEILGKEMVGKCRGLPLAIVILSGVLSQKKTYTFWSGVKDHLWRNLKGKSSEIQEVLNLSYDDLSSQTRKCFLYLARFPEDTIIDVSKLKLLWIAEGFISEADEEDGDYMEDIAEDYMNELINRNMIQMHFMHADGQVLLCRVHDLVRDLAIEKAKEQKILGIFDSSKQHPNPILLLQGQTRHAICNGIGEYLKLLGPISDKLKLRSLLISETARLEVEEMKLLYTRFKYLGVLDLTSAETTMEGVPDEIGDLNLLKFLGLMGTHNGLDAVVIPPSIGKLKKLQTLCGGLTYNFPREMCDLKELRHLIFDENRESLNIGPNQTKLQTINQISYGEWCQIDTINLTNLHTLVITRKGSGGYPQNGYSLESIANLTSLQRLCLYFGKKRFGTIITTIQPLSSCKHLKMVTLEGMLQDDPAELSFLPDSVSHLRLGNNWFTKEDPMPTLGRLPNLTALCFESGVYTGDKMVCGADAFPCLQYLNLDGFFGNKELQFDDGALPSLKAFDKPRDMDMDKIPQRISTLPLVPNFWGLEKMITRRRRYF